MGETELKIAVSNHQIVSVVAVNFLLSRQIQNEVCRCWRVLCRYLFAQGRSVWKKWKKRYYVLVQVSSGFLALAGRFGHVIGFAQVSYLCTGELCQWQHADCCEWSFNIQEATLVTKTLRIDYWDIFPTSANSCHTNYALAVWQWQPKVVQIRVHDN